MPVKVALRYTWIMFLVLVATASPRVSACACADQVLNDRDAAAEQFRNAVVVFEGEVVSVSSQSTPRGALFGLSEITFRVTRSYKGSSHY